MSCKDCERQAAFLATDIEALVNEQLALEINLVSENEWRKRQLICESCPYRQEHTCSVCGCFYKFRTALSTKHCPMNYWK